MAALAAVLGLGACSHAVNLAGDQTGDDQLPSSAYGTVGGTGEDGGDAGVTVPGGDASSIPTVPINGPIPTIPEGPAQIPASKPPQTIPPNSGWGGNAPPSFPNFTFGLAPAATAPGGTVKASGSGCSGDNVQIYLGDGGEGDDGLFFAEPRGDGTFDATIVAPRAAGTYAVTGNCVAIGSSGQTHVGGTFGPVQLTVG